MIFDKEPSQKKESYISWGQAIKRNPAERLNHALSERQTFIESIYYQNSSNELVLKPLTEPMKRLIIDPLNECIDKGNHPIVSRSTARLLPNIDEWQQKKAPDLTYKDFKIILAKEHELDENAKIIILQQFLVRTVQQYYQSVTLRDYQEPMDEYIEVAAKYAVSRNAKQSESFQEILENLKKVRHLTNQMKRFGVDKISKHYERIQSIKAAVFPKDIDIIINSTISEYPRISTLLQNSPLETANIAGLDELSRDIFFAVRDKRLELRTKAQTQDVIKSTFSQEDLSKNLSGQFKIAFENLISLIPEKDRHFLDRSPYHVLKLAMALRKILPVANAEVLSQIWWQLRLGGPRAADIINHVKKEWPAFVKKQKLERYARHLADNFLGSEASSFEFLNVIPLNKGTTPNTVIFQIVKNLIRNHIPKDQKEIRFTLLNRDKELLKISIPYKEGLPDSEIERRITMSLKANLQWRTISLAEEERAKLSYLGHNSTKRKQSKVYQAVYQGFGKNQETKEDYDGDYLIQVGSIYEDSRDPRSLFAVDSHKAAVQLKFNEAGKVNVTTRYNHQHFDGKPAKLHTGSLMSEINKIEKRTATVEFVPRDQNSQINYLKDGLEQPEALELPLLESRADYDDNHEYTGVSLTNNVYLSSTDLRSLTIAKANGIQYYQQLIASEKANGSYFVRNPNADNIQPIVVSPTALKRHNRVDWVKNYRESNKRAKESVGDVALFASIAGTRELPLSYVGSFLNPVLINMLSHSQGMVSPLLGQGNFTTAFSDAYRPATIDLNNPVPHMGVIGMLIDKQGHSHYTVRLLPSQAQNQFREAALKICNPKLNSTNQQKYLEEFTKIIKAWDRLVAGQGTKSQITLEQYENIRDGILKNLIDKGFINSKKDAINGKVLQIYLNTTLKKATEGIFDKQKLNKAREELMDLLKN